MTRMMIAAALGATMLLAYPANAADSNDGLNRWVRIFNKSTSAIISLEAINVDYAGEWNDYLSPVGAIEVDGAADVKIDDGMRYCRFDIYVTFADDTDYTAHNVNVCDTYGLEFE